MSTYLQLCQHLGRILRAGNNTPGTQPVTVAGTQIDPLNADIIYFVNEAYGQIQEDHPSWLWMRNPATLVLPINTSTTMNQRLPLATIKGVAPLWRNIKPFVSAGERYALLFDPGQSPTPSQMPIYYVPYLEWRGWFDRMPRSPGQPVRFTEYPNYDLYFDAPPLNAPSNVVTAYNLIVDYRTVNQVLAADADVPLMPADYHELIVYWAGYLWAQTRSGGTVANISSACTSNMKRLLDKLRAYQLPEMVIDNRYA